MPPSAPSTTSGARRRGEGERLQRAQDQHHLLRHGPPYMYRPGFARRGWPELNIEHRLLRIIERPAGGFREGAGPDVDLLLDINFNFKTEAICRSRARSIRPT